MAVIDKEEMEEKIKEIEKIEKMDEKERRRRQVAKKIAGAVEAISEEEGTKAKDAVESIDENAIKRLGE